MTSSELLKTLRTKGYTVSIGPDGRVSATGVVPKDPARAAKMLSEHEANLRTILTVEAVLGGVLK